MGRTRRYHLWNAASTDAANEGKQVVVLLPDHGIPYHGIDETQPLKNHIPMIWVGGAVKEPRRIEQVCNQTDLAATLLGQLGISHDDYTFSRDVLSDTYTEPFAINTYDDGFSMYDSTSFVNYDFISNRVVASQGNNNERLIQRAKDQGEGDIVAGGSLKRLE